ncbi:hypothetical protein AKJ36_03240 [candidate division MSBL1 archaeon SCGC-AAA259I07]|uniref:Uncharacterized protein n=1 Tax=candidate division MSBL1 archaeon SCGC-AAA259I07 TaxID=1698266 RepID=A0A133UJ25_9EURY|nr:hypothetical protein AKJ36_03240 [candidate division MSBL1 archaeon SCGC-AAA259I07]
MPFSVIVRFVGLKRALFIKDRAKIGEKEPKRRLIGFIRAPGRAVQGQNASRRGQLQDQSAFWCPTTVFDAAYPRGV